MGIEMKPVVLKDENSRKRLRLGEVWLSRIRKKDGRQRDSGVWGELQSWRSWWWRRFEWWKELVWNWAILADAKTGIVGVKELGGCPRRMKRKSQEKCSNKLCASGVAGWGKAVAVFIVSQFYCCRLNSMWIETTWSFLLFYPIHVFSHVFEMCRM